MKVLIIEDESLAARQLKSMIEQYDTTVELVGILDSVESSVDWFQQNEPPDLLLADIELIDGQSFDVFNQVDVRCPVIFTTAYDEYALKAFQVNSIDYLLKPIDENALHRSLTKFRELKSFYGNTTPEVNLRELVATLRRGPAHTPEYRQRFLLKQGTRLIPIETRDIAYFFSKDRLTFVRTWDNRTLNVDYTLDELSEQLNPKEFYRANRQFILGIRCVEKVHMHFNGRLKLDVLPEQEEEVFISRDKAAEFRQWMGE